MTDPASTPSLPPPRILVADDDRMVRTLLSKMLSSHGAVVVAAPDGQAALREALLAPFDLCILDVEMPVLGGLETCARLRATAFTKDLPVLFLTAHTDGETIERAFAAGASDYLSKPIHAVLLWQRVSNLLLLAGLAREKRELAEVLRLIEARQRPVAG
ncbi:MAG: response regulator [Planctomycetota bacterium]|nr:response regulator [Planctomycetota bacterium]